STHAPRSDTGATIRVVEQGATGAAAGYEAQIFATGTVPTRRGDSHDAFNALCWLAFPELKRACNALHVRELARPASGPAVVRRGPLRDAVTLLDESGVIVLCADPALSDLLVRREWKALFHDRRSEVARCMRFWVCGHALYEKLLDPYPAITGRALIVQVQCAALAATFEARRECADEGAAQLVRKASSSALTSPLPLAGIPGWHPDNDAADFYDDVSVFRPRSPATAAGSLSTLAHSASAPAPVSSSGEP
ncbi:MAG: DUF3025 domain-containing protein, partial [Betaproteobacteria bacterium]